MHEGDRGLDNFFRENLVVNLPMPRFARKKALARFTKYNALNVRFYILSCFKAVKKLPLEFRISYPIPLR